VGTKKERELLKKQERMEKDSTPASQEGGEGDNSFGATSGALGKLSAANGKPASYVPWHTCPKCKRSLLITRFAQHLEKCLGISGRQSSRNAMAKLSGNGNGSNAPSMSGSRASTPVPASQGSGRKKVEDDEGSEEDIPVAKKKKKSGYIKKADREKFGIDAGSGTPKEGRVIIKVKGPTSAPKDSSTVPGKRPPKSSTNGKTEDRDAPGSGKRERDRDDESPERPKKKSKLVRPTTLSTATSLDDVDAFDEGEILSDAGTEET